MGHDYAEKSFWYELILNSTKQCCVSLFTNEVSPGKLGAGDPGTEIQQFDLGPPPYPSALRNLSTKRKSIILSKMKLQSCSSENVPRIRHCPPHPKRVNLQSYNLGHFSCRVGIKSKHIVHSKVLRWLPFIESSRILMPFFVVVLDVCGTHSNSSGPQRSFSVQRRLSSGILLHILNRVTHLTLQSFLPTLKK